MEQRKSNDCKNCSYYRPHYVKAHGKLLEAEGCSHCKKRFKNGKQRKPNTPCDEWKPRDIEKENLNKKMLVETILSDIHKKLLNLLLYLQD